MYSMLNGAQEQAEEGEASGGESEEGEWKSDDEGEEDEDGSSKEEEEMEVDPPRTERRSKLAHDPARERGKAVAPLCSRQSALGRPLRRRLKKRRSIRGQSRTSHQRPCPK